MKYLILILSLLTDKVYSYYTYTLVKKNAWCRDFAFMKTIKKSDSTDNTFSIYDCSILSQKGAIPPNPK